MTSKNTEKNENTLFNDFIDVPVVITDRNKETACAVIKEINGDMAHAILFRMHAEKTHVTKDYSITKYVATSIEENIVKFVRISKIETSHFEKLYTEAITNGEAYLKRTIDGEYSVLAKKKVTKTVETEDFEEV